MTAYHSLVTRAATTYKVYRQAMALSPTVDSAVAQRYWRMEVHFLINALRRHTR